MKQSNERLRVSSINIDKSLPTSVCILCQSQVEKPTHAVATNQKPGQSWSGK